MNIQVIWENGVFRPTQPLQLKHSMVTIQVPDEEIAANAPESVAPRQKSYALPPEVQALAERMTAELEGILDAPFPSDEALPPLSQKHIDCIAAFATREDR